MTRRGQAAIEFLVLSGFMVLVFTTFFLVIQQRSGLQRERELQEQLISISDVLEMEVSLASRVRAGYNRTFELPTTIGGKDYDISLYPATGNPSELVISTGTDEYVLFLQVNLSEGSNIRPGYNEIRKSDRGTGLNISISPVADYEQQEIPMNCQDYTDCQPSSCETADCNTWFICLYTQVAENTACTDFANGVCDPAGECIDPICLGNSGCDDSNECTVDTCSNQGLWNADCSHTNKLQGTPCSTGTCDAGNPSQCN